MAPDLKRVLLAALIFYTNVVSASIFEPSSPLNIIPGKLESEVFESTDSEILRDETYMTSRGPQSAKKWSLASILGPHTWPVRV